MPWRKSPGRGNKMKFRGWLILGSVLVWSCGGVQPPVQPKPPVSPEIQPLPEPPSKEIRALWLTRFEYCNYSPTHDQDSIRHYIDMIIDSAAQANFNVVFFQVRGSGDAYYRSELEPWGPLLTGTLGQDPGWDPLDYALERCHQNGLELHAWFNTFPAWRGAEPPPVTDPPSPYLTHPEWLVCDSLGNPMPLSDHYVSFSPGIPQVHDYLIQVATDLVRRYDVDGIHFDYVRFPEIAPESGYSHDSISVALWRSETGNPYRLNWADWEREQLNHFIAKMYNALMEVDSSLIVSAATIGSYWRERWNAYYKVYQDPRRWTEWEKMDWIVPMIYWPRSHPTQPFLVRSREYRDEYTLDRYLVPGIGSYRYNTEKEHYTWAETEGEIDDLRREHFPGMSFFNAGSILGHFQSLEHTRFSHPAALPPLPWKNLRPPLPPDSVWIGKDFSGQESLFWSAPADTQSVYRYLVYISRDTILDATLGRNLVRILPPDQTYFPLPAPYREWRRIGVSTVNKAWVESGIIPLRRED
ncbi:MAG: hypothetical protein D6762_09650 [Candidatus Neomarinimicrobiota bacterium]|nr:MAG: hypothetical protein D6762_09650 [Candidatus Neomarinimicrobiota bacterium]